MLSGLKFVSKALAKRDFSALQRFGFLPHPANVSSLSHQETMLYETFFSISIKNVSDFDQKHNTTNLCGEQCFALKPSSKHAEGTPVGPFDRLCAPSPPSDKNFKMADNEEDCSGEISGWYEHRNEGELENCDTP